MSRDILFKAKAINRDGWYPRRTSYKNGDWVFGLITRPFDDRFPSLPAEMKNTDGVGGIEIDYKTISQCTNLTDDFMSPIFENDIVDFMGMTGVVVFEHGTFCIAFDRQIDYTFIDRVCVDNFDYEWGGTRCDYIIPLFDIYDNFNCHDNSLDFVKIIGNKFDNQDVI